MITFSYLLTLTSIREDGANGSCSALKVILSNKAHQTPVKWSHYIKRLPTAVTIRLPCCVLSLDHHLKYTRTGQEGYCLAPLWNSLKVGCFQWRNGTKIRGQIWGIDSLGVPESQRKWALWALFIMKTCFCLFPEHGIFRVMEWNEFNTFFPFSLSTFNFTLAFTS